MASSYDKYFMKKFHGMACLVCGETKGTHAEHVKTKGSGGDDELDNVIPTCIKHHQEKNSFGISHMAEKYPKYEKWLLDNRWFYSLGKWRKEYDQ